MYLLEPEFRNEPLLLIPPRLCLTVHSFCLDYLQTRMWTSYYTLSEIANYVCYVMLPMVLVVLCDASYGASAGHAQSTGEFCDIAQTDSTVPGDLHVGPEH